MIAVIITVTIVGGIGFWALYNPPGLPSNIDTTDNQPTQNQTKTTPEPTNATSPETDETPEITNTTDTTPETPQLNETEVIVIDDIRFFSWKIYSMSQPGFGTPVGGKNDKEIKAEIDAYMGKTLEITTNATTEMYGRNLGYSVNGVLVKEYVIFLYSDYKDYMIECVITDDAIQDFQNIRIGDIVTFQGKLFSYNKVSDYQQTLPGSLPRNTILCKLKDCRIVETQ